MDRGLACGELLLGTGVCRPGRVVGESYVVDRDGTVTVGGVVRVSDVVEGGIVVFPVVNRVRIDQFERSSTGRVFYLSGSLSGYSKSSKGQGSDSDEGCTTSKHIVDVCMCVYKKARKRVRGRKIDEEEDTQADEDSQIYTNFPSLFTRQLKPPAAS
jgi:hypothetical protein